MRWIVKLKSFYVECVRVLKITKRPDKNEFQTIVKVTALGILVIGLVGFITVMIRQLLVG